MHSLWYFGQQHWVSAHRTSCMSQSYTTGIVLRLWERGNEGTTRTRGEGKEQERGERPWLYSIPSISQIVLISFEIRLHCNSKYIFVSHIPKPAPVAEAQKCTNRLCGQPVSNMRKNNLSLAENTLHVDRGSYIWEELDGLNSMHWVINSPGIER